MENQQETPQQAASTIVNDSQQSQEAPQGFFSRMSMSNDYETKTSEPEQAQETTQEPEVQPEPENQELYSKSMAMIAKRERALLERESRIKQMEETSRPDQDSYEQFKKAMELKDYDPMGALEALGMDYESISKHYSSDTAPASKREALLQKEIDELKGWRQQEIEEKEKRVKEQEQAEKQKNYDSKVKGYMSDLKKTAEEAKNENGASKYKFVTGEDAYQTVFEVVNLHYKEHGKILSNDEALQKVENYLADEWKRMQKYNEKPESYGQPDNNDNSGLFGQNQQRKPTQNQNTTPNTLNNSFVPSNPPTSNRAMTKEESLRHAASLIQWDD